MNVTGCSNMTEFSVLFAGFKDVSSFDRKDTPTSPNDSYIQLA